MRAFLAKKGASIYCTFGIESPSVLPPGSPAESHYDVRWEATMKARKRTLEKDRLKDRSDIGEVEFSIEKLMKFRDASASCVHIEAAMEADRGLTNLGKKRSN